VLNQIMISGINPVFTAFFPFIANRGDRALFFNYCCLNSDIR
jgi:hypothetical protein